MPKKFEIERAPESEQLRKKRDELSALEEELAYGELEFHSLKLELDSFRLKYMQVVGVLLSELDDINDRLARTEGRLHPDDETFKRAAEEAHARAEESWRTTNNILKEEPKIHPSEDLKKLYWEVARKIHPDLCTDESDKSRRQSLMVEANVAFEAGDEERLRSILLEWEPLDSKTENGEALDLSRMTRMIELAQRRLAQIQLKISELTNSELNELRGRVKAAGTRGRELLNEMAEEIRVNIVLAKHRLKVVSAQVNHGT
jgi:hypothetical protein